MLILHKKYHWDFVIIQLNYIDWKIATGSGIGAEYLYTELEKRGIPVIIMEPLLGGRLSKLPNHVVTRLKQQAPENSVASWAFRFCGSYKGVLTVMSGMTYIEHLQDNLKKLFTIKTINKRRKIIFFWKPQGSSTPTRLFLAMNANIVCLAHTVLIFPPFWRITTSV